MAVNNPLMIKKGIRIIKYEIKNALTLNIFKYFFEVYKNKIKIPLKKNV